MIFCEKKKNVFANWVNDSGVRAIFNFVIECTQVENYLSFHMNN